MKAEISTSSMLLVGLFWPNMYGSSFCHHIWSKVIPDQCKISSKERQTQLILKELKPEPYQKSLLYYCYYYHTNNMVSRSYSWHLQRTCLCSNIKKSPLFLAEADTPNHRERWGNERDKEQHNLTKYCWNVSLLSDRNEEASPTHLIQSEV